MTRALIVVDGQQGFDSPVWGPRNNPVCEDNIAALLADELARVTAANLHGEFATVVSTRDLVAG